MTSTPSKIESQTKNKKVLTFEDSPTREGNASKVAKPSKRNERTPLISISSTLSDSERNLLGTYEPNTIQSLTSDFVQYVESDSMLKLCVYCILLYLLISVIAFSYLLPGERWPIVDSLYFAVVTFTTIGYGDLTPSTKASKIVTIFFVLFGIAIAGVALGIAGERLIEREEKIVKQLREKGKVRIMTMLKDDDDSDNDDETLACCTQDVINNYLLYTPLLSIIILCCAGICYNEGWSFVDSMYYCIITTTTVGYGDLAPKEVGGRLCAALVLPLSVFVLAKCLGEIAQSYIDFQSNKIEKDFLQRQLTLSDLEIMDTDRDGSVSLGEFLSFMLVAMQKVDKETMDELIELFNELDVTNGGTLVKEDLILRAKKSRAHMIEKMMSLDNNTGKAPARQLLRQGYSVANIFSNNDRRQPPPFLKRRQSSRI